VKREGEFQERRRAAIEHLDATIERVDRFLDTLEPSRPRPERPGWYAEANKTNEDEESM
jgi:hypothetical protein